MSSHFPLNIQWRKFEVALVKNVLHFHHLKNTYLCFPILSNGICIFNDETAEKLSQGLLIHAPALKCVCVVKLFISELCTIYVYRFQNKFHKTFYVVYRPRPCIKEIIVTLFLTWTKSVSSNKVFLLTPLLRMISERNPIIHFTYIMHDDDTPTRIHRLTDRNSTAAQQREHLHCSKYIKVYAFWPSYFILKWYCKMILQ